MHHLERYIEDNLGKQDIFIAALDFNFVEGFYNFLLIKQKQALNTAAKTIERVKAVIKLFVKRGIINKEPFGDFTGKKEKVNTVILVASELDQLAAKEMPIDRISQVRDLFLFACYTGLAYADLAALKKEHIRTGTDGNLWITIKRTKTGILSEIPLLPPAQEILDKYSSNPLLERSGKILPMLSNQKLNAYLLEVADLAGIGKKITMHVARHTFATTVTLANGVSLESVSQMLGHSSIKMTQKYAKIQKVKVSKEMTPLFEVYKK